MQTRPVGQSGVDLSVVGFGTAQLQMVPERTAIDTLVRGFELGVNWVHTAPDYGGVDPWIQRAIEISGRDVNVLTAGPAETKNIEAFFENACHVYKTDRLALYGLSGIEDIEYFGENIWGRNGMVEFLQEKKAEGRLGGIYCSTHAESDYVVKLIESGVFDALMLAWNPLGFHQQSQRFSRESIGRSYEDLREYEERIFPLAAERNVGLMIMKPFAGGLLCKGKAFEPNHWFTNKDEDVDSTDVLKLILEKPGVCAVLPGCASVIEAEQNALAGHDPLPLDPQRRTHVERVAESMRTSICSRCGDCLGTCSKSLPIPALFRDAYIWNSKNETVMSNPTENYFDLHPDETQACVTCEDRTCLCPQGIDIPLSLGRVHESMQALRAEDLHPGPTDEAASQVFEGEYVVRVHTVDVPDMLCRRQAGVARFLIQNLGETLWLAPQHCEDPAQALGVGVLVNGRLRTVEPLRNSVHPEAVTTLAFEFKAPRRGRHQIAFTLMPLQATDPDAGTEFYSGSLDVQARSGLSRQRG